MRHGFKIYNLFRRKTVCSIDDAVNLFMDDFNKPKIVWGNLSLKASFAKAPAGMFVNAPCVMITPFSDYLLAVLNSKLGDWYIRQLGVTRNGGYFEYKPMFVGQLPVPKSPKSISCDADVYGLYGLDEREISFIEGKQS